MSPTSKPAAAEPVRLSAEADFSLGELEIRPSLREVAHGGRRDHIEPRVMQVLVALVRAQGAVVSREDLILSCWDGRVVGEAAINRCIFKLRELADGGDGRTFFRIETIARVGYRIEAAASSRGSGFQSPTASSRMANCQITTRLPARRSIGG